jgi:hypothetical protein
MKLNSLASLGVVALLAVVGVNQANAKPPSDRFDKETSPAVARSKAVMQSGNFRAGEHPIQGRFSVVTKGGERYLVLNRAFKTQEGPDVLVILHRSAAPPTYGIRRRDYVSLGRLQSVRGTQSYRIPENINLENYNSVAIWCRKFNANFGYARL